jgi:hypothetical protein
MEKQFLPYKIYEVELLWLAAEDHDSICFG